MEPCALFVRMLRGSFLIVLACFMAYDYYVDLC